MVGGERVRRESLGGGGVALAAWHFLHSQWAPSLTYDRRLGPVGVVELTWVCK